MKERRSLRALDWLNFFMADVETGIGPFVATYLSAAHHWNPAQIGMVIGAQSIAEVAAQTPAGWLIDRVTGRKWLIAGAAVIISAGCLLIVAISSVAWQMANQVAIGISAAFVSPTVAAISRGLVGREAFARRVGRNAAFSHGGNVTTALFAGYLGYAAGQQWIFYACACLGAAAAGSVFFIRDRDIDNDAARAMGEAGGSGGKPSSPRDVLKNTTLFSFAFVVVVFHLANAPMLALAGQELAKAKGGASSVYMSACIVTAQAVMVPAGYLAGRFADRVGRKPMFLFAFAVLAVRGVFFALGQGPYYIVGVQTLDGIGTAIASVMAMLVVSDLAKGTGRFNLMQGVIQSAVGTGAFLGHSIAGFIAKAAGFPFAFSALAGVALLGAAFYAIRVPETRGEPGR